MSSKNITVEILKKNNQSLYPEHITVRNKRTSEFAHLYFDKGSLVKITYLVHDSAHMKEHIESYIVNSGKFVSCPVKSSEADTYKKPRHRFFINTFSSYQNHKVIFFFDGGLSGTALSIDMDSNYQCLQNAYIHNYDATIETYTRQTLCPNLKNCKESGRI